MTRAQVCSRPRPRRRLVGQWMQAAPLACAAVRRLGGLGPFLDRAAGLAETRRAAFILFLVALGAWWLEALIIPLGPGRDFGTYLGAYAQLFQAHPIDLGYVLGRTPGAPLVVGSLLDFAGGALAEPVVSVLYASSVTAWFIAARSFGGRAALFVAVVLITFPGYGLLFHELSSDAVFAAAFAGWSLLAVRVLRSPSPWRVSLLGFGVGALVLIRPGSQILLLLTPLALALRGSWRIRVVSAFAFAVPVLIIVGGWTLQNGVRYDDYTLARGANSGVPFYRAFVTDHIVRPGNGPASRRLAQAVQRELLPVNLTSRTESISTSSLLRQARACTRISSHSRIDCGDGRATQPNCDRRESRPFARTLWRTLAESSRRPGSCFASRSSFRRGCRRAQRMGPKSRRAWVPSPSL